ncbi:MAG: hypothetical protein ACRDJO_04270 [Actinomycetota bacterium]
MDCHDDKMPAHKPSALQDQTPEERAAARKRLEELLKETRGPVTIQTARGALQVGSGDERGFTTDDEVPEALSEMREIWARAGQMGSKHDPTMKLPSVFKEEIGGGEGEVAWSDLPSSGQSTYDTGEAVRRAREAFRATLRREGKLRE